MEAKGLTWYNIDVIDGKIIPVIWGIDVYEKAKPMVKQKILLAGYP